MSAKPATPMLGNHFDPKFCKRHAHSLARTLWAKVLAKTYSPKPALRFFIDKAGGGKRQLMAFGIPDSALANVLMRRIRHRNLKKFSPHSFAYHPDKNLFDAIIALKSFIDTSSKVFCVQIDFKDYFDSIPGGYLRKLIDDPRLLSITGFERYAIRRFLVHEFAQRSDYAAGNFSRRHRGTPQGSSVSLILANLANHSLDTALEKMPGKFVRFADDVTALCTSYEDAVRIEKCFFDHSVASGILINQRKSHGIGILSDVTNEIRTVGYFDYLGYRFTQNCLTLSEKRVRKIKSKISGLVDIYLINPISKVGFRSTRVGMAPNYDWDLLGLICEIRNYIYGGLTEKELRNFLRTGDRLPRMRGLMGFYALLDDKKPLVDLDGWLLTTMRRACHKRSFILSSKYGINGLRPGKSALIDGSWLDLKSWKSTSPAPELGMPSFVRGWRAARKHYLTFGLEDVEPDTSYMY